MWLVAGPDTRAAIREFLVSKLGFDGHQVDRDFGPLDGCRVVEPRSKIRDEVIVEFPTSEIRDFVKSTGYKLMSVQAGIRIEVPNFLKSDFHVFQNLSSRMKQSHGGAKRSIKFDDDVQGLMLDIQLPGQNWQRIRPAQA